jgi:hypothetical protein
MSRQGFLFFVKPNPELSRASTPALNAWYADRLGSCIFPANTRSGINI